MSLKRIKKEGHFAFTDYTTQLNSLHFLDIGNNRFFIGQRYGSRLYHSNFWARTTYQKGFSFFLFFRLSRRSLGKFSP